MTPELMMMERLHHYFTTYKLVPGVDPKVSIERVYGTDLARQVIRAALADYDETFARYSRDEARDNYSREWSRRRALSS